MNIDERVKKAYALHHSGYNCAQAVLGAYVDLFDLDMDIIDNNLLKVKV